VSTKTCSPNDDMLGHFSAAADPACYVVTAAFVRAAIAFLAVFT
jgi:hypothetical protein